MNKRLGLPLLLTLALFSEKAVSQTIANLYAKSGLGADKFVNLLDLPKELTRRMQILYLQAKDTQTSILK